MGKVITGEVEGRQTRGIPGGGGEMLSNARMITLHVAKLVTPYYYFVHKYQNDPQDWGLMFLHDAD